MSELTELHFYIDSEWDFKPPVVRIWVDGLLISERAVTPKKQDGNYLDEKVQLNLEQGKHNLVIENIKVALAEIQLHAITANGVHIPFKSSDDIYYEAVFEI
jgi:hypothetical protein